MMFLRARLAGLSALTLGVQLSTLGFAVTAVCAGTDAHHHSASAEECHMPAAAAATCPMHQGQAAYGSHHGPASAPDGAGSLLRCNCSSTTSIDGLVGTAGVITSSIDLTVSLMPAGMTLVGSSTPIGVPAQVSSPPPRS